jgi:hypothetical protein
LKLVLAGVATALVVAAPAGASPSEGSQRCFWVSGRLSTYNGSPTFRIWPRGTKRLLGVTLPEDAAADVAVLPPAVEREKPSFSRDLWGEFRVCPLTADRPGHMRMVTLADGRRLRGVDRPDP